MAAGDRAVYREATGGQAVNGTAAAVTWDTEEIDSASSFSESAGAITLPESGKYLVTYTVGVEDDGGSGRTSILTHLELDGAEIELGRGYGYMRRSDGADEVIVTGAAIIEPASADLDLEVIAHAAAGSTSNKVMAGNSGVSILKLDDSWDCFNAHIVVNAGGTDRAFIGDDSGTLHDDLPGRGSGTYTLATLRFTDVDEVDTATFGHSTSSDPEQITLKEAGHYLVVQGGHWEFGGRNSSEAKLELNGTPLPGVFSAGYTRDATHDTVWFSGALIVEAAADDVLEVTETLENGGGDLTTTEADRHQIFVVKLPSGGEYLRIHESTAGGDDSLASGSPYAFDTEDEDDFSGFTAGNSTFDVPEEDDYLVVSSYQVNQSSNARAYLHWEYERNGTTLVPYGGHGMFSRGTGGGNYATANAGAIVSLLGTDTFGVIVTDLATGDPTLAYQSDQQVLHALRLGSIFAGGGGTTVVRNLTDGVDVADNDPNATRMRRDFSEAVDALDITAHAIRAVRDFQEGIAVDDSLTRGIHHVAVLTDLVATSDALNTADSLVRLFESGLITDDSLDVTKSQATVIVRTLVDSLEVADVSAIARRLRRDAEDTLTTEDQQGVVRSIRWDESDTLGLSDAETVSRALTRAFTEALSVEDQQERVYAIRRLLSEVIDTTDSVSFVRSFANQTLGILLAALEREPLEAGIERRELIAALERVDVEAGAHKGDRQI